MPKSTQDPAGRSQLMNQLIRWVEDDEGSNNKRLYGAVRSGGIKVGVSLRPEEVRDGMQETLLAIIEKILAGTLTESDALEPAIFGTGFYEGLNTAKRRLKQVGLLPDEAVSDLLQDEPNNGEVPLINYIERAIDMEQDPTYRDALRRQYLWFRMNPAERRSHEEVAEMFGISVRMFFNVRKRMIENARNLWKQRD